jgi:hypothetical protein
MQKISAGKFHDDAPRAHLTSRRAKIERRVAPVLCGAAAVPSSAPSASRSPLGARMHFGRNMTYTGNRDVTNKLRTRFGYWRFRIEACDARSLHLPMQRPVSLRCGPFSSVI